MNEDSQIVVPDAFVALFKPAGAIKPVESSDVIAARHELCEDMAQMLTETARSTMFELGIAEDDVLERVQQGLLAEGSVVSAAEAWWVTGRLAELLEWPLPAALG
ncbi:MAG: ATPase with chaperone activity [Rubrivivax sp.]|nr:ATPase with chaperone activity [Rubrivivax sp.]